MLPHNPFDAVSDAYITVSAVFDAYIVVADVSGLIMLLLPCLRVRQRIMVIYGDW